MTRRLNEVVLFRAFAILLIVAGHSFDLVRYEARNLFDADLHIMLKGGTALFVFISGFLFDYVYAARYDYRSFMRDKIVRVLVPYLVLTTLMVLLALALTPKAVTPWSVFEDFVLGQSLYAYWYVPFIMLMFATAPLHKAFLGLAVVPQITIILVLTVLAGVIQRPVDNLDPVQSVIYYMPIYLLGAMVSAHREVTLPALRANVIWLALATLAVTHVISMLGQQDNLHKPLLAYNGFELMGIQKMLLSLTALGLFGLPVFRPARLVTLIAETSFAIFFLHLFFVQPAARARTFRLTGEMWFDLAIGLVVVVAFCIGLALVLRRLFGKASKYIIGY